jgi:hypothetical protein
MMKNRIQELTEQALKNSVTHDVVYRPDGCMNSVSKTFADNFAELIIRDCLTIIRMNDNETPWFSEADGRARTILREVKQHFGVE